jgi:hypothetical protein
VELSQGFSGGICLLGIRNWVKSYTTKMIQWFVRLRVAPGSGEADPGVQDVLAM